MKKALKLIKTVPWLSTEDTVSKIAEIASRKNTIPENLKNRVFEPIKGKRHEGARNLEIFEDTAILKVIGPIFRYASIFEDISGAVSVQGLNKSFKIASETPGIKRIIQYIDSPGGEVAGISEYASMVRNSKIPVISVIGGMAASGGYWIASAASKIYVANTSMVGSIGAVMSVDADSDESTMEFVSSVSPYKRPSLDSDDGRMKYQTIVDKLGQVFVNTVAEYRGVTTEQVIEDFGKGGLLVGEDAVAAGMADGFMTIDQIIEEETMENKEVVQEGKGYDDGIKDERERVGIILDNIMPGCEEMAHDLVKKGASVADSLQAMIAHRKSMKAVVEEEIEDVSQVITKNDDTDEEDAAISAKFDGDEKAYSAYKRAMANGLVKIR